MIMYEIYTAIIYSLLIYDRQAITMTGNDSVITAGGH